MGLIERLKQTGRRVAETLAGDESTGDRDILDTLKQDHDDIATLLDRLGASGTASERKALLTAVRRVLVPHLRAEEKTVYDPILALRRNAPKEHGEEGYLEHGLADKTLASLFKIDDPMAVEFAAGVKVLRDLVAHHFEEEETNVWADLREHFPAAQRAAMNRQFAAAKKRLRVPGG